MADVSPVLDVLSSVGVILLPGAIAMGATMATKAMKARGLDTMWFETVARAGGMAYATLRASGQPMNNPAAIKSAAVVGAQYLAKRMPDYLAAKNIDVPASIDIVHAQLGTLMPGTPDTPPPPKAGVDVPLSFPRS